MRLKKNTILLCIILFSFLNGISQETKQVKKFISPTLIEKYSVLKSDKHIKEGNYTVTDLNNHILVLGQYKNNKKDSIWNYMNEAGNVIQKYNYSDSTLLIDEPDEATFVHADYKLDDLTSNGGKISAPYVIGGASYGFYLFYNPKDIPPQVENQTAVVKMTYSFSIEATGKVKTGTVHYSGAGIDLTEDIPVKNLPEDVYSFLPAQVDGKAVNSTLMYSTDLNINKSRLPREYSTPTQDSKMSQGVYH